MSFKFNRHNAIGLATVASVAIVAGLVLLVPSDAWAQVQMPSVNAYTADPGTKATSFISQLVKVVAVIATALGCLCIIVAIAFATAGKVLMPLFVRATAGLIAISCFMWMVNLAMSS